MEKIKVSDFVKKYKACENKKTILGGIGLQKYVSYKVKVAATVDIIQQNFTVNDSNMIYRNTPLLYLLNKMTAITLYCPGLEVNLEDAMSDFDALNECGAIDDIYAEIGKDVLEFDTVFNMVFEDLMENTMSTKACVNRVTSSIADVLSKGMLLVTDLINRFDIDGVVEAVKSLANKESVEEKESEE